MSQPSSQRWPRFALAGIVVVTALVLWTQAVQVGLWTNDEDYFVQLARLLTEHFPSAVVDLPVQPFDDRGIQRLNILLLAWPLSIVNGETGFAIARALMCLVFASAAIPAYVLARGIRLPPWWALLAATMTVVLPWATLSATFLSENVAYPMVLWAIWGAWRAVLVPGIRSDVLAIALALAAALARTNMMVLLAVAPVALAMVTAVSAWRDPAPGAWRRDARGMFRAHPLLSIGFVLFVLVVLLTATGLQPGIVSRAAGGYYTQVTFTRLTFEKAVFQLATIIVGLGIVPVLLGVPWVLHRLLRPDDVREQAFAACALVAAPVIMFSTIYAADEERYVFFIAFLALLPAFAALARRGVPALGVAATSVLLAVIVGIQGWESSPDTSRFVTYPAQTFLTQVGLTNLDKVVPFDPRTALWLLVLAAGALIAVLFSGRIPAVWLHRGRIGLAALVTLFLVLETQWLDRGHANRSAGNADLAERVWIDATTDDEVGMLMSGFGNTYDYAPAWRELAFWNRRAELLLSTEPLVGVQIPRQGGHAFLGVDAATGRLVRSDGGPIPRYIVTPTRFRRLGLDARVVRRSTYLPLQLEDVRRPVRLTYQWAGATPEGFLTRKLPDATATLYPAAFGAGRTCLSVVLSAPNQGVRPRRYVVRSGGTRRTGRLAAGARRTVSIPVRRSAPTVDVVAEGFTERDDRGLGILIGPTSVGRC